MAGITGLKQFQLGKEVTSGVPVSCTTYLRGETFGKDESKPEYPPEDVGIISGVGRSFIAKQDGTVPLVETPATFEQLPYLLNAGIRGVAGVADGPGTDFIYTYPLPSNTVYTPYTYTARVGDNQQAELWTACFAEEITIKGEAEKAWTMAATFRGWPGGPTTFTGSVAIPTVSESIFGLGSLWIDAVSGTIGTTQKTNTFRGFELKISKIYVARWAGNATNKYYTHLNMNGKPEITCTFKLEHDTTAVAERAKTRARTPLLLRMQTQGAALGTAGTAYTKKTIRINLAGSYSEPEEYSDDDGTTGLTFKFVNHYDVTAGFRGEVIVANELSALP